MRNRAALAAVMALACLLALVPLCPCMGPATATDTHGCCAPGVSLRAPDGECCRQAEAKDQAGPGDASAAAAAAATIQPPAVATPARVETAVLAGPVVRPLPASPLPVVLRI